MLQQGDDKTLVSATLQSHCWKETRPSSLIPAASIVSLILSLSLPSEMGVGEKERGLSSLTFLWVGIDLNNILLTM